MKKLIALVAVLAFLALTGCSTVGLEKTAGLAIPPAWKPYDATTIQPATSARPNIYVPGVATVGGVVSETGVEYPVVELPDLNGDIVGSITYECSDLTDGSQDCEFKFYIMVGGSSVVALTLDAAEE